MINLIQIIIFTLYIALYWNSGTKSISMTAYLPGKYRKWGFTLFMIAIAIPFALEEGKEIYGFGMYQLAAGSLIWAGLSHLHKEKVVKQIHHVTSTIAITAGFLALGLWTAVITFACLCLISYIVLPKYRFLWFLEIWAFYTIMFFRV